MFHKRPPHILRPRGIKKHRLAHRFHFRIGPFRGRSCDNGAPVNQEPVINNVFNVIFARDTDRSGRLTAAADTDKGDDRDLGKQLADFLLCLFFIGDIALTDL